MLVWHLISAWFSKVRDLSNLIPTQVNQREAGALLERTKTFVQEWLGALKTHDEFNVVNAQAAFRAAEFASPMGQAKLLWLLKDVTWDMHAFLVERTCGKAVFKEG